MSGSENVSERAKRRKGAVKYWTGLQHRVTSVRCGETFSVRNCVRSLCKAVRCIREDYWRGKTTNIAYEALVTEEEQRLLAEFEARDLQRPIWAVMPYYD